MKQPQKQLGSELKAKQSKRSMKSKERANKAGGLTVLVSMDIVSSKAKKKVEG